MRILIAVPTFENIYPDTFKSIYDLDKCGHECLFEFVRGYDVAMARNKIASRSLDINADYVFIVPFPPIYKGKGRPKPPLPKLSNINILRIS